MRRRRPTCSSASNSRIKIKIEGKIIPVNKQVLTADQVRQAAYGLMNQEQIDYFQQVRDRLCDLGAGTWPLPYRGLSISAAIPRWCCAYITADMPSLEELGLPMIMKDLVMIKRGLILMVGATGSGKSTSLAAMLND